MSEVAISGESIMAIICWVDFISVSFRSYLFPAPCQCRPHAVTMVSAQSYGLGV